MNGLIRHGHSRRGKTSSTYWSWHNMKRRCYDQNNEKYPQYGARGIAVCERWMSFDNFLADMGSKPAGMTLERKDVNGHYKPSNCVWASTKVQANNKTNNRMLTHGGVTLTSAQWAERLGISFVALRMRLHRGWSVEKCLTQPLRIR